MADFLIGIDIGTTSVKAALVGLDGQIQHTISKPYPTARPAPAHVEQTPADWMEAVRDALSSFAGLIEAQSLAGIGVCSQVNTHVFVDTDGDPLMPAIVWQDGRCAEDAAMIDAQVTLEQKMAWFGAPMPVDASHALSRMAHVARLHPEIYARTKHVLLPKDFCALRMTGEVASDAISAVGLVGSDLAYIDKLVGLVPEAQSKLPPLRKFTEAVGTVRDDLPFTGTPVFVGTMDAWAGMFGIGVANDGDAMYLSGTSEILGVVSATTDPTPGVIVFPPYEGITLHAAPTQSGGASLVWLCNLLGREPEDVLNLAATTERSESVPLFLPHLQGERAPLWDVNSRGVFARLDAATDAAELSRSVLEGVAFSARLAFEALEASAARTISEVHIGGGGSRSDLWCQIRADTLGKALRRATVSDAGTLGAAILAGLGAGSFTSLRQATDAMIGYDRSFEPDLTKRDDYDDKFGRYLYLYRDLKDFNRGYG